MTQKELEAAMKQIVFDFDKEQLMKIDKAFGVIHELLPSYFKACKMAAIQSINTGKLSKLS